VVTFANRQIRADDDRLDGIDFNPQSNRHGAAPAAARTRFAPANSPICFEGDPAAFTYKILEGVTRSYKMLLDGRRQIVAFGFVGDWIGAERCQTYFYSTETVTACRLAAAPKGDLHAGPADHEQVFGEANSAAIKRAFDHLLALGQMTAAEKVSDFLLFLDAKLHDGPTNAVRVPMERSDIADYLGLTVETVCRQLSALKRRGLIETPHPKAVRLVDRAALARLAGGARPDRRLGDGPAYARRQPAA